MKDLIIIGASGFGREVAWLAERINAVTPTWRILGFVDDNEAMQGQTVNSYPVLGGCACLKGYPDAELVCAVGSSRTRHAIIRKIETLLPDAKFATLIDPRAVYSDTVEIGEGSIICCDTILTVNVKVGRHVILNLDCTVGHDAVLGDFVTGYPSANISGNVTVGEDAEIGTGAHVIQGMTIGAHSIVGAGAVVVKDIPEKCTAVGSPAKPIKFFE